MKKTFVAIILLANIGACASTGRDYVYYVIHPEVSPAMLYGKTQADDLDLVKTCTPNLQNHGPCIGVLSDEYFAMKQELLELRQALIGCQQGPPPGIK